MSVIINYNQYSPLRSTKKRKN